MKMLCGEVGSRGLSKTLRPFCGTNRVGKERKIPKGQRAEKRDRKENGKKRASIFSF